MPTDAQVVVDAFELAKALLPAIGRFPRSNRFTLGDRMEERALDLVEALDRARVGRGRKDALDEADERVQGLGLLLRLACDLRFVSRAQYGELAERLTRIGKQVGGRLKYVEKGGGAGGSL